MQEPQGMGAAKQRLTDNILELMKHNGETQTDIGKVIGCAQPQISLRLRWDTGAIDWKFGELVALAEHWGIPYEKLFQPLTVVRRWVGEQLIDLSDKAEQHSSCNADLWAERPTLFDDDHFFFVKPDEPDQAERISGSVDLLRKAS